MTDGHIKYGWRRGGKVSVPSEWVVSQAPVNSGPKFVIKSGDGVALAGDGADEILGHADYQAVSATVAGDPVNICVDPSAVYRIPVDGGTYVKAMQFDTCDLGVTGGVQGADLEASVDNVFIIVDGDTVNNAWVDVMLNQNERGQVGCDA